MQVEMKAGVATLRQNRHVIFKGSIQDKDVTVVNMYTSNIGVPKYIKQILMDIKTEINCNSILVGDFNSPFSPVDHSDRKLIKNNGLKCYIRQV